ncbi:MAG: DUF2029 domain-containing protein, partial [Verrucomicrobiae bacterium]|nr:DUF2029 domain-containing protein [Verrucomicrobiae bacterium]
LAAAVVALLAWPIVSGLERGQTSPLIAWLVTVAVGCVLERAWWRGGAALAGAIVLKIFPALLVPFLAWKRQWRSVVAAGIWLAVLIFAVPSCVFGFEGNWKLLHQWWGAVARPANEPERALENRRFGQMINPRIDRNQSLQAVTIRWFGEGCERVARFAAMVVNLMLVLVSCVAMRCRAVQPRRLLPELCIVLVLMVVLAPVSWLHNFIVLLLPLAVAVGLGFGCGVKPMQVAVGAFAFAMFAARVVPACYKYGCVLLATLLLWAVFVWWTGRRGSVSTAGLV